MAGAPQKASTLYLCRVCGKKIEKRLTICNVCNIRNVKRKYKLQYIYREKRHHAEQVGHLFDLSYFYFERLAFLCEFTKHIGNCSDSLVLDRIDNNLGYTNFNVQITYHAYNNSKFIYVDFFLQQRGTSGVGTMLRKHQPKRGKNYRER